MYKACPVVLRQDGDGRRRILAFEHPQAGKQLIKGTIEQGEPPDHAALRELAEESGIFEAVLVGSLGRFEVGPPHQVWLAYLCEANE